MNRIQTRGRVSRLSGSAAATIGFAACAIVVAGLGCGRDVDRVPTFPVRGAVTYNGEAMEGASVVIIPVTPLKGIKVPPFGVVGKDGRFAITTYGDADGAPAGEYRVTLTWSDGDPDSPTDLCRGRFADPKKPIATVTVVDGENEIPAIALRGAPIQAPSG